MNENARKSIQTIIQHATDGKLGAANDDACFYHRGNKFCAIGCLLTPEEHTRVDQRHLNTVGAETLFIELPGLADRLGFTYAEAKDIQQAHDVLYSLMADDPHGPLKFIAGLERCLAEGRISYAFFSTDLPA